MIDFFVNLIGNNQNMNILFWVYVVFLVGGAVFATRVDKKSDQIILSRFLVWAMSVIILMVLAIAVSHGLHAALTERKAEFEIVQTESRGGIFIYDRYIRSRTDTDDEFGPWIHYKSDYVEYFE